ncbi:tRNA (adenosine(37)-N6)-dimethylallyltransferase MiaA [Acinetobacter schindleri]|jgi:tRNA dimethylallyltransferase|uniref:tRNA dimethylallyltransferase n=1 Tax=Acinetobacter schindleri NIPH 900 TaxID=1217675 RepID=N8WKR9_9GAMM|nr:MULTISPECIES: tRNA (adenosine(37)-N6)-dimethylallyltransferase MiaA [Acinetobacter]ENV12672.1 tRNA dimethylallyltransferase [Acinetobacter schindleri NIPH 900]MBB4834766.1 tRNA dimethylallyltransferase [Acinetobacter schindleri]MCU4322461.1 tRNA (adenosine(37)-N6)-dimethylallyltransferase MiaA [Acinetobacter schindleri]MDP1443725.1 tRNA (adenosine(37)-N6)-dimethylallyltransferase MiaA [Acinetobacter schindleri]OIJ38967.1 tRNA (adenosine(37)-N6)-dimethylallyltransferase MiaA [Acinetobacter s
MSNQLPVINLMGPTASGKTALACELYEQGNFELISVDSALVYREMDIGTAKPTKAELEQYPHHLIDIISPLEVYSAANFVEDACRLIDDMHARGKTPILVGGTMLYFKALLEGLSDNLPSADYKVRAEIEAKAEREGWEAVYAELCTVDPVAGQKFKVSDKQRIIRALEVYKLTGQAITKLQAEQPKNQPYRYSFHNYALIPDRVELHKRIEKRLEIMWEIGFLNEVKSLMKKYDFDENLPSMRSVGYRQAIEFIKNSDRSVEKQREMEDKALFATRQLAKRQYTWLRSLQDKHKFTTYFTAQQAQEDLRNCYG